jgi:ABC-type uncharacterized transport system permease subunit
MGELFQEAILVSILAATVRIMTPLLFAAIGELVTQRAGIWNMGVEGTMLMGAFVAYIVVTAADSLVGAVLAALLAGALMGLLVAFMTVTLRVDHFVTGLGLNLLASGLTLFWFRIHRRPAAADLRRFRERRASGTVGHPLPGRDPVYPTGPDLLRGPGGAAGLVLPLPH